MSFLLHWSTYLFSTAAQAFKLGFLIAVAFESDDLNERFPIGDGPAVEFQEEAHVDFGEVMILEAVPGDNVEPEIMFVPREGGVVEGFINGILDFEPLLEIVEMVAQEGVEFDFELGNPPDELRPIMMVELNFVRHVLPDLTLVQKRVIWNAAEASLKQSVKQILRRDDPKFAHVVGVLDDTPVDPNESLRQTVAKELKKILTADQFERFATLAENRQSQRKTAAILGIVSRMDGKLYLSQSQRDQLINSISLQWNPSWASWMDTLDLQGEVPQIPETLLTSCLNEEQQSAWRSLQVMDDFGMGLAVEIDDDDDSWWNTASPLIEPQANQPLIDESDELR